MKALAINIIGISIWILTGRFLKSFGIFIEPIYITLLFLLVGIYFVNTARIYWYAGACFILILLNDKLFWNFGGIVHDDVGRSLFEIVFYVTMTLTTICFVGLSIFRANRQKKAEGGPPAKSMLLDISIILAMTAISILFYQQFNYKP
jgi:hypothetical protein